MTVTHSVNLDNVEISPAVDEMYSCYQGAAFKLKTAGGLRQILVALRTLMLLILDSLV